MEGQSPPFAALFFLLTFSFAPTMPKEKVANSFLSANDVFVFINSIVGFSLQSGGAKKNLLKRDAEALFRLVGEATRAARP